MLLPAFLLVLPMALASTTATSRSVNCEFTVVDNPRSVLSHSKVHEPPVEEYQTDGITECMDVCCNSEFMCNVGLFLDETHKHDTNCLLYSCYPLDSCSPKIRKGTEVFVDRPSLDGEDEHYQEPTVSPYAEIYSDEYENQEDDEMDDGNPSVVNTDDINEDSEDDIENTATSSPQTVEQTTISQITPSDILLIMSSLIELTASSESAIEATATIIASNSEDSLQYFDDIDTTFGEVINSDSDILSPFFEMTASQPTPFETSDYMYSESLSTTIFEHINDAYLDVTNIVHLSATVFDSQFWNMSTILESSTSYGILEEPSIEISSNTLLLVNSPFAMEISSTWLLLESSSIYTIVAGTDDSDSLTVSEPIQPTETLAATTSTQEVPAPSDVNTHVVHNETSFENVNTGQDAVEPVTAILICIVTVGCVFVLAVVGVLGVRLYEGYRKRHYSRLDYLINGMYS